MHNKHIKGIKGFMGVNITSCDLKGIDIFACYYKKQINIVVANRKRNDEVLINTAINKIRINKEKIFVA